MRLRLRTTLSVLVAAAVVCGALEVAAASRTSPESKAIVVVLHGLGRSRTVMWLLARRLESAGFRAERIGYRSLRDPPEEILRVIGKKIADCCVGKSTELHFVGHSFGGLLIRAYLADNDVANLGRVVLIGTPNKGSEIVDVFRDEWWFKVLGPTARSLGTGSDSFAMSLPPPDYPLGVIAGKSTATRNEALLPGDDDGLVSVQSTKVAGMSDFLVVDVGHSMMRYDGEVADQTISFLKTGQFETGDR